MPVLSPCVVFSTCIASKEGVVATTKWVWAVTDVCELCHSSATVLIVRRALSLGRDDFALFSKVHNIHSGYFVCYAN